jgi:hypothetical protein
VGECGVRPSVQTPYTKERFRYLYFILSIYFKSYNLIMMIFIEIFPGKYIIILSSYYLIVSLEDHLVYQHLGGRNLHFLGKGP